MLIKDEDICVGCGMIHEQCECKNTERLSDSGQSTGSIKITFYLQDNYLKRKGYPDHECREVIVPEIDVEKIVGKKFTKHALDEKGNFEFVIEISGESNV